MPARTRAIAARRATPRQFVIASLLLLMLVASATFGAGNVRAGEATPVVSGDDATPAATAVATAVATAETGAETDLCETLAPGTGAEAWVRSELYFGTTIPDGTTVSDEQFQTFLDEEITPRFPDGLTVLEGYGQFLNDSGTIIAEESIVLIIFIPLDFIADASVGLEEIRDAYETAFEQESVLRVDSAPICVSF